MDRQSWLNWRKIGSSDAPIILGVSPFSTPRKLWEERVLGKERVETPAMRRGNEMEGPARKCFERKMGVSVFPRNVEHSSISFMTASLDGIDLDDKVMVEIKCPNKETHRLAKEEKKVPNHYYPQLQHQLEVTGLESMYYFSFDGTDGVILEVGRDQEYINKMIEEEGKFWNCLIEMEAPDLSERDYIQRDDDAWRELSAKWAALQADVKRIEEEEKLLRHSILSLSSSKNATGAGLKTTKMIVKGAIDYSKVPELQGINLEQYRKATSIRWRITSEIV